MGKFITFATIIAMFGSLVGQGVFAEDLDIRKPRGNDISVSIDKESLPPGASYNLTAYCETKGGLSCNDFKLTSPQINDIYLEKGTNRYHIGNYKIQINGSFSVFGAPTKKLKPFIFDPNTAAYCTLVAKATSEFVAIEIDYEYGCTE